MSNLPLSEETRARRGHTPEEKAAYAAEARVLCAQYDLPFSVGLVLGTDEENYAAFTEAVAAKGKIPRPVYRTFTQAGNKKRKAALIEFIGEDCAERLGVKFYTPHQSARVIRFLIEKLGKEPKKATVG